MMMTMMMMVMIAVMAAMAMETMKTPPATLDNHGKAAKDRSDVISLDLQLNLVMLEKMMMI